MWFYGRLVVGPCHKSHLFTIFMLSIGRANAIQLVINVTAGITRTRPKKTSELRIFSTKLISLSRLENPVCSTILLIVGGGKMNTYLSRRHLCKVRCKQLHPKFELGLLSPFSIDDDDNVHPREMKMTIILLSVEGLVSVSPKVTDEANLGLGISPLFGALVPLRSCFYVTV